MTLYAVGVRILTIPTATGNVALDALAGHVRTMSLMARTPSKIFLVQAETPRKAENRGKQYMKQQGIEGHVMFSVEAEHLPIHVAVRVIKQPKRPPVRTVAVRVHPNSDNR